MLQLFNISRLSALKHESPTLCAKVKATDKRKRTGSSSGREIKQVINGLEDDIGSLTLYVHFQVKLRLSLIHI